MTFDDLRRIVEKWERTPDGCAIWRGTVNSQDQPVVKIAGRTRGVRAVLRELLYGDFVPEMRACDTPGCVHPRHDRRRVRSTVAV